MPTIRGFNVQASSANSYTVTFPGGSVAGDLAIILAGGGYDPQLPSGWTDSDHISGSNWNGRIFSKSLSAGDISTGSVTVAMSGGYDTVVAIVVIVGSANSINEVVSFRSPSGTSSNSLTTSSNVLSGDLLIYFGSNRASSTDTVNRGVLKQAVDDAGNASGCLYVETGAVAPVTATFNYSSSGDGHYEAIAVVRTITIPVISNVVVSDTGVKFNTDQLGDTQIEYGPTNSYGTTFSSTRLVTIHNIYPLGVNTTYHFRVKSTNGAGTGVSGDFTYTPTKINQSYLNIGGWGNRSNAENFHTGNNPPYQIPVLLSPGSNVLFDVNEANLLVTGQFWQNAFAWSPLPDHTWIRFDFSVPRIIDEAIWFHSGTNIDPTDGVWKWQGSNDNSAWTDIGGTFELTRLPTRFVITTLHGNTRAYRYYRMFCITGVGFYNAVFATYPYQQNVFFRIDGFFDWIKDFAPHTLTATDEWQTSNPPDPFGTNTGPYTTNDSGHIPGAPSNRAFDGFYQSPNPYGNQPYDAPLGIGLYYYEGNYALGEGYWWISIDLGANNSRVLGKYGLISCDAREHVPGKSPKNWLLQGSNNNVAWTTLDTVTNEVSWAPNDYRTYLTTNTKAYRYYRLYITANNGWTGGDTTANVQIAEIFMFSPSIIVPVTANVPTGNYFY